MGKKKMAHKQPSTTDALAAYLRQQDPNRDWTATLAGFSQGGGALAILTPTPEIPNTINLPTTIPTSWTPASEKSSPTVTAPSESANPSPMHQKIEPLDVSPLSAYQDPDLEEKEDERREKEKEGREGESEERGNESRETPVVKPVPREEEKETIDLNETTKKQGLMTDTEF